MIKEVRFAEEFLRAFKQMENISDDFLDQIIIEVEKNYPKK